MTRNKNGNGKSSVTAQQLKEAIARQESKCSHVFDDHFNKIDVKLDKITETLGYVNTMLSERLSNHAVRIKALEAEMARSRSKD